jgi:hypothetical protein
VGQADPGFPLGSPLLPPQLRVLHMQKDYLHLPFRPQFKTLVTGVLRPTF